MQQAHAGTLNGLHTTTFSEVHPIMSWLNITKYIVIKYNFLLLVSIMLHVSVLLTGIKYTYKTHTCFRHVFLSGISIQTHMCFRYVLLCLLMACEKGQAIQHY